MKRKLKSSVGRFKGPSFIYRKRRKPTKLVLFFTRTVSQGFAAVATLYNNYYYYYYYYYYY